MRSLVWSRTFCTGVFLGSLATLPFYVDSPQVLPTVKALLGTACVGVVVFDVAVFFRLRAEEEKADE